MSLQWEKLRLRFSVTKAMKRRSETKREVKRQFGVKMAGSIGMSENHLVNYEDIRFDKKIGEGGFAVVWKCTHKGEPMVVKQIKSSQLSEEDSKLLAIEIRIWSQVQHQNIVAFNGACLIPNHFCLLCEEMGAGSLFELLQVRQRKESIPFPEEMLLEWCCQISSGMTYLHSQSPPVIHRDLKSANILLDHDHNLKIADFGLARYLQPDGNMTAETGSYRWMAPEVLRHEDYGTSCDVFSFAVLLWEMLTFLVPFAALKPVQAAIQMAVHGARPPLPNHCKSDIRRLVEMGWAGDHSDRPSFELVKLYLAAMKSARAGSKGNLDDHDFDQIQQDFFNSQATIYGAMSINSPTDSKQPPVAFPVESTPASPPSQRLASGTTKDTRDEPKTSVPTVHAYHEGSPFDTIKVTKDDTSTDKESLVRRPSPFNLKPGSSYQPSSPSCSPSSPPAVQASPERSTIPPTSPTVGTFHGQRAWGSPARQRAKSRTMVGINQDSQARKGGSKGMDMSMGGKYVCA